MKPVSKPGLLLAVLTLLFGVATSAQADDGSATHGKLPTGVYLVDAVIETIGNFDCEFLLELGFVPDCVGQLVMTVHADGTVVSNDQNDFVNGFDGIAQGIWSKVPGPNRQVSMRMLNTMFDPTGLPDGYQVRNVSIDFEPTLDSFVGNFVASRFDQTQDPLDPATVPNVIVTASLTGRRFE